MSLFLGRSDLSPIWRLFRTPSNVHLAHLWIPYINVACGDENFHCADWCLHIFLKLEKNLHWAYGELRREEMFVDILSPWKMLTIASSIVEQRIVELFLLPICISVQCKFWPQLFEHLVQYKRRGWNRSYISPNFILCCIWHVIIVVSLHYIIASPNKFEPFHFW